MAPAPPRTPCRRIVLRAVYTQLGRENGLAVVTPMRTNATTLLPSTKSQQPDMGHRARCRFSPTRSPLRSATFAGSRAPRSSPDTPGYVECTWSRSSRTSFATRRSAASRQSRSRSKMWTFSSPRALPAGNRGRLIRWRAAESRDRRASVQGPFNIMRDRGSFGEGRENRRVWQSRLIGG